MDPRVKLAGDKKAVWVPPASANGGYHQSPVDRGYQFSGPAPDERGS
jgi:hypothetical protein